MFSHPEFEHELVVFHEDHETGLKAIIAIHNSNLGPAIGGCRMMSYASDADALTDVLRLSKGMTYKCAIAGIPFGGGKSVIIGDPKKIKTKALLHAMGVFVDRLEGQYITSFDAGTTIDDVATMGEKTCHVGGIQAGAGNASSSTAKGVFVCLKRSASLALGASDLKGVRVAIQGVGNVGARLARLAADAGAEVAVADVNEAAAAEVATAVGARHVAAGEILSLDTDILAPCALGAVLNEETLPGLKVKAVCGGANNQLENNKIADRLMEQGVFYCPDYLANAGGIIDLHYQLNLNSRAALEGHLEGLAGKLVSIAGIAQAQSINMAAAADRFTESLFQ